MHPAPDLLMLIFFTMVFNLSTIVTKISFQPALYQHDFFEAALFYRAQLAVAKNATAIAWPNFKITNDSEGTANFS